MRRSIRCPGCSTDRVDFGPVIRYEGDGEVRMCLSCGMATKFGRTATKRSQQSSDAFRAQYLSMARMATIPSGSFLPSSGRRQ